MIRFNIGDTLRDSIGELTIVGFDGDLILMQGNQSRLTSPFTKTYILCCCNDGSIRNITQEQEEQQNNANS